MSENNVQQFQQEHAKTFVWHELYVPNVAAAQKFYSEAFDFGTSQMDMGEIGTYHMFTKNGTSVAGIADTSAPPMAGDNIPPHWATYLAVDDVDSRVEKAVSLGATLVVPAMNVETVGRMALIADPQGAHIWIFTPAIS